MSVQHPSPIGHKLQYYPSLIDQQTNVTAAAGQDVTASNVTAAAGQDRHDRQPWLIYMPNNETLILETIQFILKLNCKKIIIIYPFNRGVTHYAEFIKAKLIVGIKLTTWSITENKYSNLTFTNFNQGARIQLCNIIHLTVV